MATVLSHAEGLLVVREQQSQTPELTAKGRQAPESVILVAQIAGESHQSLASRALGRASRELSRGHLLNGVIFSVAANASPAVFESRRELLQALVTTLAQQPDSELVIAAPANTGASERIGLFDLVESTIAAAPRVTVRLTFDNHTDPVGRSRRAHRRAWQPAQA